VVRACEVVDECVGRVVDRCLKKEYTVLLMADHGNADHMLYDDGSPDPSHGLNPVRLTLISGDGEVTGAKFSCGGMKDISPTILSIMGIGKPAQMTGESLVSL